MALTHIDCFSGPGGICTGLHAADFETLIAIEVIKSCVDTYAANHPEVHVIQSDIRNVTAEQILPYIPENGVDLVTSGMPCETHDRSEERRVGKECRVKHSQLRETHLARRMTIGSSCSEKG